MPINLTKHSKIWINAEGIIPEKIFARLILQREVRPNDTLTLFVNHQCLITSENKIQELQQTGIHIIVIESALSSSPKDDPFIINIVRLILEESKQSKNIKDYVYAADLLRMMYLVLEEGLYSDTDVFFLKSEYTHIQNTSYLLGCHETNDIGADVNVLGIDAFLIPKFYSAWVEKFKQTATEILGSDQILASNVNALSIFPSILYIPEETFEHENTHTLLNYAETQNSVIYTIEDRSWCDEKNKQLLYTDGPDSLIIEVKKRLAEFNYQDKTNFSTALAPSP